MQTFATPYNSTVSVAASSKDMTLLNTVKTELSIGNTDYDVLLGSFIQQASAAIVSYCRREFARETLVDTFRIGGGITTLQLTRRPIVSVTSIVEDGVTLDSDDYEIIAANGWLNRLDASGDPQCWECGKIVVTHVAGWLMLTDLPSDLERVTIDLVKSKWFARDRDPMVKSEGTPGVYEVSYWVDTGQYVRGLPAGIAAKLDELGYVDPVV
jgi:hypothetical protein